MSEGMNVNEAREVSDSTYWGFIKKEIQYRIDLRLKQLRICKTQEELNKLNSGITVLEEMLSIPENVIDREQ